ncbi:hypothetical protein ABZ532_12420 [Streptomyces sp. NPDC019396]|uniref:hypothetical protein n=1 Tax=Streptomyces sp. NPDC019396 TaxID=3154687 RepID=UPI00340B8690
MFRHSRWLVALAAATTVATAAAPAVATEQIAATEATAAGEATAAAESITLADILAAVEETPASELNMSFGVADRRPMSVSDTSFYNGETVEFRGTGYDPGETVYVRLIPTAPFRLDGDHEDDEDNPFADFGDPRRDRHVVLLGIFAADEDGVVSGEVTIEDRFRRDHEVLPGDYLFQLAGEESGLWQQVRVTILPSRDGRGEHGRGERGRDEQSRGEHSWREHSWREHGRDEHKKEDAQKEDARKQDDAHKKEGAHKQEKAERGHGKPRA